MDIPHLSIPQLRNIYTYFLERIMLLCQHMCLFLFFHIYPGVELLDHVETLTEPWRNCQTVCQSCFTILHSYPQCLRVSVSPHSYQCLLLSALFDYSHPSRYEVLSHCFIISLTAADGFFCFFFLSCLFSTVL